MYRLKLFFEWGGGCLWCDDKKTTERLGAGNIEDKLPLRPETRRKLEELSEWHNGALDWNNPPGPSPWTDQEFARFHQAAQEILTEIQRELGPDFILRYKP